MPTPTEKQLLERQYGALELLSCIEELYGVNNLCTVFTQEIHRRTERSIKRATILDEEDKMLGKLPHE